MQRVHWLLVVVMVICCVSDSLAASKDREFIPKKKNRDPAKIRSDLATNETAVISQGESGNVTNADKEKENQKENDKETSQVDSVNKNPVVVDEEILGDETTVDAKPKPTYLTKVRNLLNRVLQILGLQRQKRKSRMYEDDSDNSLNTENSLYTDEVRATVGAILGRRECLKKAACGAGTYLRNVKGKEVLIVLLEKFTPTSWADSVNMIKDAAIYKDPCHYRCLED